MREWKRGREKGGNRAKERKSLEGKGEKQRQREMGKRKGKGKRVEEEKKEGDRERERKCYEMLRGRREEGKGDGE